MGDVCVVCGESAEGKPLYKKLGSGEYNVEVLTALRALQLTIITDADKNNGYICWDCDEVIVAEYGRYLESEESKKTEDVKQRRTKKHHKTETKKKKSKPPDIHKGKKIRKLKLSLSRINLESTAVPRSVTKAKKQDHKERKISKVHQTSHCVMCDKSFENGDRGYQRFNLMKMVNDEMDVAEVMQLLGLARHIAPEMKKKRFVCNPCYYIIRRNYKNKLLKGTSIDAVASGGATNSKPPQNPIHRATTQEHAAEIAKLLPPALAECYKILTGDSDMTEKEILPPGDTSQQQNIAGHLLSESQKNSQRFETGSADDEVYTENDGDEHSAGTEPEDEDSGFNVSQDKFGNYVINMDEVSSPRLDDDQTSESRSPHPSMSKESRVMHITRKKNVLLPKRRQHHLSAEHDSEGSQPESDSQSLPAKDINGTQSTTSSEDGSLTGVCNICGIKFTGKPTTWWYSLNSLLAGFENITVTIALRLLETSLADTSKEARIARQVCPMCYGMVSAGFRSQVTQRVEQQLHVDPSQVNISKMKVQTIPRPKLKNIEKEAVPTQSQKYVNEDINNIKRQKRKIIEDSTELSKAKKTKDESTVESQTPRSGKNVVRINKRGRKRKPIGKVQEQTSSKQEPNNDGNSDADDSKPPKPIVLLEDLRSVLPAEAFGGKPVSALQIEENISQSSPSHNSEESATAFHSEMEGSSPPASHLIFSSITPSQEIDACEFIHHADKEIFANQLNKGKGNAVPGNVRGRCVICGCNYYVEQSFWKNINTMIRPPSLMISLRWVCISLNVTPVEVSIRDQELGKVCKYCFGRLGKHFESFVKSKVGESSGIPAKDVKLKDYTITFNPDTMNIEADPVRPQKREQDEMTKLLKRILQVMKSFSIDDLVSKPQRQPLEMQEFSIWMLLVLNDFRVQIGAAIGDLATWLTQLMPNELYDKGLRPCQSKLAHYLLTLSKYSSNMDNDEMSNTIPGEIFIVTNSPKLIAHEKMSTVQSVSGKSKKKADNEFDKVNEMGNKSEKFIDSVRKQEQPSTTHDGSGKAEIHWEDFLRQTSLDELMEGTAKPMSLAQFSNGVIYSLWRTSLMIGGGSETVRGWLMQIAPILLDHEQTEKIISGVKSLHEHLEKQPEDVCKLGIQVIPFLRPGMKLRVDGQVSEVTPVTEVDDPDTLEFNILGSLSTNCSRTIPNAKSNGKAKGRNPSVPILDDHYCEETSSISDLRGANRLSLPSAVRRNRVKKKTRGNSDLKVAAGDTILNSPEKSLPESDQSPKEGIQVAEEGSEKKRNSLKSGITGTVDLNHITSSSLERVSMKISSHVNSTKLKEVREDSGKSGGQLCLVSDSKSDNKMAKAKDRSSQLNNTESDKVKGNTKTQNDNEKNTVHVENSKASPYKAKVKRKLNTDDVTVKVVKSDGNSKASLHETGSMPGTGKCLSKPNNLEVPRLPGKPVQGNKRVKLQQFRGKANEKQVEKHEKQNSGDHKTIRNSGEEHLKHKSGELNQGIRNRKIEQESISKKPKSIEVPETQKHLAKKQNQPSNLSKSATVSSSKVLSSPVVQRSRRLAGAPALSMEEIDTKEKAKKIKPTFEDLMNYDT
ncbi:uncharacterized protein LOC125030365 [Penaeus chinensis]|uniref:uncharacterized protein LOC125030365 n=1 Tax=Penaeus chinensis TaxID=139456 RepID=UPI001FB839AA|nr:uncharacterized protein LOC125030365 [Penaeus chinensis]XP_047476342.1 uncharacterized protein LOC125030365 [Penaeus chinensis]XP_047476343.1 uncharacterized protein LOC125030365 [Penaeus chinensis]XP_047476344.1 uncharacterized protein LOC125030365 [Penaeus chinensis]